MKEPFTSVLKSDLQGFLSYERALGFRYERQENTLRRFDRHVRKMHRFSKRRPDLRSLIESWLAQGQGRKPITVALDLTAIRQFCLYLRRRNPGGFVPDRQQFPRRVDSQFLPYVLSQAEVRKIMRHISHSPGSRLQRQGLRCSGWFSTARACGLENSHAFGSLI